jgi:glycosyltransferase involved in cell wall biosynthesis
MTKLTTTSTVFRFIVLSWFSSATPANPKAIVEQIYRLIVDENQRRRIGENTRETAVRHYSWVTIAEKYRQLYSELL